MEPRIQILQDTPLLGLCHHNTLGNQNPGELWKSFRQILRKHGFPPSPVFYNVTVYEPGFEMRHLNPQTLCERWAAIRAPEGFSIPAGLKPLTLPGGTYAVFQHRGPASTFPESMRHFFGAWLPHSGYQRDDRPHFEIMGAQYRPDDPQATEDVWIPIR